MKTVIANGLSAEALQKLSENSIDVIQTRSNEAVDSRISFHTDISFLFDGFRTLFIANEMAEYKKLFENVVSDVVIIPEKLGKTYPEDVLLNCAVLGRNLICNVDTVSPTVLKYFREKDFTVINVRQGYTKCSVLPVSDNALLTDDTSVAEICVKSGLDVLFVSKGSVTLEGFDYGFIGGSGGRINNKYIAFCGVISAHPDYDKITLFLRKYSLEPLSLDNNRLYDIGSIIPLYGG